MGDDTKNLVADRLKELGVEEGVIAKIVTDLGAEKPEDLANLTEADLTGVGMKALPARNLLRALTSAQTAEVATDADKAAPAMSVLEQLPPDEILLESLRVGGILKVEHARVVMAGRCLWAQQTGMFGGDVRLMNMIDNHYTNSVEEPNPPIFWELNAARTRTRYASVFNALKMPGASVYATVSARNAFWEKMNQVFIPKLQELQRQLTVWYDTWMKQATANVGLNLGAAIAAAQGRGGAVPTQRIPPIIHILAAVDGMVDSINKVFAGRNEVVAIALAVDAQRLRELLKRNDLHTFTGSASREVMLRDLGVAATTDVIQMEISFSMFLHNAIRVKTLPPTGVTTAMFLQELQEIGGNIDWDRLSKKVEVRPQAEPTGIGGRRRARAEEDSAEEDEQI